LMTMMFLEMLRIVFPRRGKTILFLLKNVPV